jgi:hypothetical protein
MSKPTIMDTGSTRAAMTQLPPATAFPATTFTYRSWRCSHHRSPHAASAQNLRFVVRCISEGSHPPLPRARSLNLARGCEGTGAGMACVAGPKSLLRLASGEPGTTLVKRGSRVRVPASALPPVGSAQLLVIWPDERIIGVDAQDVERRLELLRQVVVDDD